MNNKKKLYEEKYSKLFLLMVVVSITCILVSNICGVKLIKVGSMVLPGAAMLFPISYILGDVFAEVYGFKTAKKVIYLGFICNALVVLFFQLSILFPAADTWTLKESYEAVLSTTPKLFIASLAAMLVGSMSNAYAMDIIKKITKGKYLWIRTIGSTLIGEFLDTLIFVLIGFTGTVPTSVIITMIISQVIWKVGYEALATPLTYYVIDKVKKYEDK